MRLFCFGYGYSAESLVRQLSARITSVAGTRTSLGGAPQPGIELATYKGDVPSAQVRELFAGTTHLLVSIPPDLEGDAVLRHYADDITALSDLAWIGYLSTVGVYGDHKGAWVDEDAPANPQSERSLRRVMAERAWLEFRAATGRRVELFRLSGIYGPGRSVIDNLRAGTARRIVKPGQVFNRIIDFFPAHQQKQVRVGLSGSLAGIVSQRLLPTNDGGRVAAIEILIMNGRIRECILNPEQTHLIHDIVAESGFYGMQTFDMALVDLFRGGSIDIETAMSGASNPHDFKLKLQQEGLQPV